MCSRYATLCNSRRTSTFKYYVSYFETSSAQKKRLPDLANFQRASGSRLFISLIYTRGTTSREWPARILSPRRLSLLILSPSLPSRLLRAPLSQLRNGRHGRSQDRSEERR